MRTRRDSGHEIGLASEGTDVGQYMLFHYIGVWFRRYPTRPTATELDSNECMYSSAA